MPEPWTSKIVIIFGVRCIPSADLPEATGDTVSEQWGAHQRAVKAGPPYYRFGGRIYYPVDKLLEYFAKRLVIPADPAETPELPPPELPKRKPPAVVRSGKAGRPRHVRELGDDELLALNAKQS